MSGKSGWGSDGDGPRPAEEHGVAAETGAAIRHGRSGGILMMASPSPGKADHTGLIQIRWVHITASHRRSTEGRDRKGGQPSRSTLDRGEGSLGGRAGGAQLSSLPAFRQPVFSLPPSAVPPRRSGWHREESRHRRRGSRSRGRAESPACACHPPSCPPRPHPNPGSPGHRQGGS